MRSGARRTWVLVTAMLMSGAATAAEREVARESEKDTGASRAIVAVVSSWIERLSDRIVATWGESRGIIVPAGGIDTNGVAAEGSDGGEPWTEVVREE